MAHLIPTTKFCSLFLLILGLLCDICLETESVRVHTLAKRNAGNAIPFVQEPADVEADNDLLDIDGEGAANFELQEIDNELENEVNVEPVVDGVFDIDAHGGDGGEVPVVEAGVPNPIAARNGWMGYGEREAQERNNYGYLEGQSKVSHIGIGFGVVILVIAVVVVSGLAIKRPGSHNTNNNSDFDLE